MGFFSDEILNELVDQLHQRSEEEADALASYFVERGESSGLTTNLDDASHEFLATKMVALEADKAQFCHRLCCAIGAQNSVEVGTSHGVSTLYLADAVRANGGGRVIATEYEPDKASIARQHFQRAGLDDLIELREGDLLDTLSHIDLSLDFVLIDIWMEMAAPALEQVFPHLHRGSIVVCDNTEAFHDAYADYFRIIRDPARGFTTQTLPFNGGFEFSVKL
jgi:predicted O-methyltransferase YrrM